MPSDGNRCYRMLECFSLYAMHVVVGIGRTSLVSLGRV